jgi:2-phospho-L-lactate/phosphoenolpyruvate guanylyltransferase
MPVPLLPVKALAEAKGRLAPWLNPIERRLLTIAMLEDVVAALQAVSGLERPVVISPDREIWRRAEAMRCRVIEERPGEAPDDPGNLNRSLTRAAAGLDAAGGLLVVAADLPLAGAGAIERVVEAGAGAPVVVVPSRDGAGTNVLAWRDPASFAPAFGPDSAARHLELPGAVRLDDPGLALDVDTLEDLRAVAAQVDPASVTGRRLRDLHLLDRLQQVG